jgi:GNAT superfamily N-acetyltransferase
MTAVAARLWAAARKDLAVFFGNIDGAEVTVRGNAILGITGGPTADFNMALFDESHDDVAVIEEFIGRLTARGLQGLFMMSTTAGGRLGPVAASKGLAHAGKSALMVLPATALGTSSADFAIERVTDSAGMAVVADLVASAFELDRTWCGRTFVAPSLLGAPGVEFFIARRGDEAMSTVTTTGTGDTIGIWSMATPPQKQRQGAGRAALLAAMGYHRNRGAETFYLCATAAGKPLYDNLGFKTVDDLAIWVVGHSEQFAAQ